MKITATHGNIRTNTRLESTHGCLWGNGSQCAGF